MKIDTYTDSKGVIDSVKIEAQASEIERRITGTIVEVEIHFPDGRYAKAFVGAKETKTGVQFHLTAMTNGQPPNTERTVKVVGQRRPKKQDNWPKPIPATQENIDKVLLRNAEVD